MQYVTHQLEMTFYLEKNMKNYVKSPLKGNGEEMIPWIIKHQSLKISWAQPWLQLIAGENILGESVELSYKLRNRG